MRKPLEFRFYLSNPIEGQILIDEPVGWDTGSFTLKRDEKYNSITFEYSSTLQFFRKNKRYNGGAEFILLVENKYGPDGEVTLKIDVSDHNKPWETIFEGRLNMEDINEKELYVECIAEQTDFFTIFNQRSGLQVSFKDNLSVDGVALQEYTPYTLNMHSKVLVKQTKAEIITDIPFPTSPTHEFTINAGPPGFPNPSLTGIGTQPNTEFVTRTSYIQFDFSGPTTDELKDYWKVMSGASTEEPPEIYTAKEAGLHSFDIRLDIDILIEAIHTSFFTSKAHCGANDGTLDDNFVKTHFIIRDIDDNEKYSQVVDWGHFDSCGKIYDVLTNDVVNINLIDYNLEVGDQVYLYTSVRMEAKYERLLSDSKLQYMVGYIMREGSYLKIKGKTFTEPSTAPALRIHDVFQNLCNKLTNRDDSFYSEDFGYIDAPYHSYTQNGKLSHFALQNGFNIRNFPWEDRPLQLDFTTLYDSLDAIFGLSLSLEFLDGLPRIRVESLGYAYTKESVLVMDHIKGIKRTVAKNKFYNQIQIGYEKSLPQDINGLDEFCTVHNYTTDLRTIGSTLALVSKIIASGSLIEVTRRNQFNTTLTTDTEYDNSLFIIALNQTNQAIAEKNENFETINNLLSPETAYNLRLWPAYNLLRNGGRINPGLLKKWGSSYNFQSGEGNYIVEMEMSEDQIIYPGSYNAELLSVGVGKNIPWAYADLPEVDPLWFPHKYEFEYPLSYLSLNLLKANRNKSITISGDIFPEGLGVEAFIEEIEAEPVSGMAKFKLLAANEIAFPYIPEDADHLLLQDGYDLLQEDGDLILL